MDLNGQGKYELAVMVFLVICAVDLLYVLRYILTLVWHTEEEAAVEHKKKTDEDRRIAVEYKKKTDEDRRIPTITITKHNMRTTDKGYGEPETRVYNVTPPPPEWQRRLNKSVSIMLERTPSQTSEQELEMEFSYCD